VGAVEDVLKVVISIVMALLVVLWMCVRDAR
jgi:hypothetical protein